MVPGQCRGGSVRARRRGLLRAQHVEVRADSHVRVEGLPPLLAVLSACHQELAWRKGLGARHHLVAISECRAKKILFTGHHASHAAAAFFTPPTRRAAILTADGVGEWATSTVGHGEKRADGRPPSRCSAKSDSRIRSDAVLDLHGIPRLRRERGRVQGDGARGLRAADDGRGGAQSSSAARPTAAFALDPEYFEYQTTARRSYSSRWVDLFGPPRRAFDPIDVETPDGRRYADCAASVQRVLEDTLVEITRRCIRRPACQTCVSAAAWR